MAPVRARWIAPAPRLATAPGLRYSMALGRLAQLVEHLVYTEGVGGSSPSPPTRLPPCLFQQLVYLGGQGEDLLGRL